MTVDEGNVVSQSSPRTVGPVTKTASQPHRAVRQHNPQ
jgi:hypothetical protein